MFEPEVSIKLENEARIKSEPIDSNTSEGHFELLQNIDSIIKNCTTVHDTIFEDVNQRFLNEDNSDDGDGDGDDGEEEEEQKKRKYKRRKNRDKLSTIDDNPKYRKQRKSRKNNDDDYCEVTIF